MFVARLTVNRTFHKRLRQNIQFSQTVDYDMDMNISAAIVTVHVRTDQCLMSRKVGFCIFQSDGLRSLSRQTALVFICWIKADNVVVAFDFILVLVLLVFAVQLLTGSIERVGFTVQTGYVKLFPHDAVSFFISHWNLIKLIMFKNEIFQCSTIIGTLTCDVL